LIAQENANLAGALIAEPQLGKPRHPTGAFVDFDEARRWLQEIHNHIAQDNPDTAYRVVTE
jgi:hypothetical protein